MQKSRIFQNKKLAIAIALCGFSSIATQVQAQSQAIEEVTVTGSFIERPANRPQPITVLSNADLQLEQRGPIAEILKNPSTPLHLRQNFAQNKL